MRLSISARRCAVLGVGLETLGFAATCEAPLTHLPVGAGLAFLLRESLRARIRAKGVRASVLLLAVSVTVTSSAIASTRDAAPFKAELIDAAVKARATSTAGSRDSTFACSTGAVNAPTVEEQGVILLACFPRSIPNKLEDGLY